jgi:hypothetical protein
MHFIAILSIGGGAKGGQFPGGIMEVAMLGFDLALRLVPTMLC